MKKLISSVLAAAMVFGTLAAGGVLPAAAEAAAYTATACTDPDNSSAGFAAQATASGEPLPSFSRFEGAKSGDYATYNLDVAEAGYYRLVIRYRAHETVGKADFYLNEARQLKTFDSQGAANTYHDADMGIYQFAAGVNALKFVLTAASTNGSYKLNIERFSLEPADPPATAEPQSYTATVCADSAGSNANLASQTTNNETFSRFEGQKSGDYASYNLNVAIAGSYKLVIRYRAHESVGKADFYLNTVKQTKTFDSAGSANAYYNVDMGVYDFNAGVNALKFVLTAASTDGRYYLNIVSFYLEPEGWVPPNNNPSYTETPGSSTDKITVYPFQSINAKSPDYTLKVDGIDVPVIDYTSWYDYAEFTMKSGPVTVEVTYQSAITSYSISPQKLGLQGTVDGSKLTFTMEQDEYLIIRINHQETRLVITADPPETDLPASSGEGIFNITAEGYGADKTGREYSTAILQKAIDDAAAYGGIEGNANGVVYVPSGVYLTGSIMLKSHVDLYLAGGAILRASNRATDFLAKGRKDSLGLPITYLIFTEDDATDVRIYGRGTVDGDGSNVKNALGFALQTLAPVNCSYFTTDGITYRNSGMWSVVPAWSNHLEFLNFKVLNTVKLGEDDSIDVVGCQDVLVRHSIGIAWDDPYTTKTHGPSGEIAGGWGDGAGRNKTVENVVFDDCIAWTGCYGYKIGQGVSFNHTNVTFQNSTVYECAVGIGIHHKRGGASVQNVTFDNIDIESIPYSNEVHQTWFVAYIQGSDGGNPADGIKGVMVKNINVRARSTSPAKIMGRSDTSMISGVTFQNITMFGSAAPATSLSQLGFTAESTPYSQNYGIIDPPSSVIPAVYTNNSGITVVNDPNSDSGAVVSASSGTPLYYRGVDFGTGVDSIAVRYASELSTGRVELHLDSAAGPLIGTLDAAGASQSLYRTGRVAAGGISGVHDLYLVAAGTLLLDWIDVSNTNIPVVNGRAAIPQVDFGNLGADSMAITAASEVDGGTVQVRLGNAEGRILGTLQLDKTDTAVTAQIPLTHAVGKRDIYLTSSDGVTVESLSFVKSDDGAGFMPGDVNGDSGVTASDLIALRAAVASGSFTNAELLAGDLDDDGDLTAADISLMLQQLQIVPGDVNGDGGITPLDIMLIRKAMLNENATDDQTAGGDMNGNGLLDPLDIMLIRKLLIG